MKTANTLTQDHDPRCEPIVAEYFDRLDRGEVIDRDAFLAAHPDLADELAEFLDAADLVERLAGPTEEEPCFSPAHDTAPTPTPFETRAGGMWASAAGRDAADADFSGPRQFGRYLILKRLGQGAMGSVYLANDTELDRLVALKIPRFLASDGADVVERFYREARASATIRHANVCPVFDVGKIDGCLFISMAYIEGEPLSSLPPAPGENRELQAAKIVAKLARALHEAHLRGVVHRDLKPANIMLDRQGEPIVTDFGLARRIGGAEGRLTQSGVMVGSPAYMSPEQIAGDPALIGPLSDIYSLGIILYELLAGKLPYEGSLFSIIGQIALSEPCPISQRCEGLAVDGRLEAICLKMMARRPEDRYRDMSEVASELDAFVEQRDTAGGKLAAIGFGIKLKRAKMKSPTRATGTTGRQARVVSSRQLRDWLTSRNVQLGGVAIACLLTLAFIGWLNLFGPPSKKTATGSPSEQSPSDNRAREAPDSRQQSVAPSRKEPPPIVIRLPEKTEVLEPAVPPAETEIPPTEPEIPPPVGPAGKTVAISTVRSAGFLGSPLGVGRVKLEFAPQSGPLMQRDQTLLIADAAGRVHYPVFAPEWEEDAGGDENTASKTAPHTRRRLKSLSAYFLFAGDKPLAIFLSVDDLVLLRGEKLEPGVAGSQGPELLQEWWYRYAAHAPANREAWEVQAYLNNMLARRLGLQTQSPPRPEEGADVSQIERYFERAVQTFFGFASVETAMQDRTLLDSRLEEEATEPVPQPLRIVPVPLPPFSPSPVESLAMRVPADCFYLRCQNIDNYLWFRNMLLQWGGSTSDIVSPRTRDTQTRERIERQLALRPDAAAQVVLRGALSDLAIIGCDPFFEDGAAVGVLFEVRDQKSFRPWITETRAEAQRQDKRVSERTVWLGAHSVSLLSSPDQTVQSYLAADGNYVFVTNSSYLAAQFFEVKSGPRSLGELAEFRYARSKVRVQNDHSAFLYLSDPFFRRLVSPQYRIELTRRTRAKIELQDLALAQLAARGEGAPHDSVDELMRRKFLPRTFGSRCDGSQALLIDGQPRDSRRGLPGTFMPIADMVVERATRSEVAAFNEFGGNYRREWRAVDPVTVVFTRRKHHDDRRETVAIDITVTPYAQQRYARLAARLAAPTRERVAPQEGDLLNVDAVLRNDSGQTIFTSAGVLDAKVVFKLEDGQAKLADGSADGSFAMSHSFMAMSPGGSGGYDAVADAIDIKSVRPGNLSLIGWFVSWLVPGAYYQADPPPSSPRGAGRVKEWDVFAMQNTIRDEVRAKATLGTAADSSQVRMKLADLNGTAVEPYVLAYTFLQSRRASARNAQLFDLAALQFHMTAEDIPAAMELVFGEKLVCPLHGTYRAQQVENCGSFWQGTHWNERSLHLETAVPSGYHYPFLDWLHGMRLRFGLDRTTLTAQVELDVTRHADQADLPAAADNRSVSKPPVGEASQTPTRAYKPSATSKTPSSVKLASSEDAPPRADAPQFTKPRTADDIGSLDLNAAGVLGVFIDSKQLVVLTVYRNSVAEQAGLRIGDKLVSVNQRPIASIDEVRHELLVASKLKEPSVVTVLRNGQWHDIRVFLAGRPRQVNPGLAAPSSGRP